MITIKSRLRFLTDTNIRKGGSVLAKYKCDCGKITLRKKHLVVKNIIKSCGCINKYHGMYRTKEYKAWMSMKQRCICKTNKNYYRYGGKGIKVYKPWINNFHLFYKFMGDAPSKNHSLDRKDNLLGYFPDNVRWATHSEQMMNRRGCYEWFIKGIKFETAKEAGLHFKVTRHSISDWVNGYFNNEMNKFYPPKKDCFKKARY